MNRAMRIRWQAAPDDLIGGWCVQMEGELTPSEGGIQIANFVSQEVAEHTTLLHNQWLEAQAEGTAGSIRPGQVWADLTPDLRGRTVEILSIEKGRAVCKVLTNSKWSAKSAGRTVKISLSRFRETNHGFRLVEQSGGKNYA